MSNTVHIFTESELTQSTQDADRQGGLGERDAESSLKSIWPEWQIDSLLGRGSYGSVYHIVRESLGHVSHAAAKVIDIPQDESEISQFTSMGMNDDSVRAYYKSVASGILDEIDAMESLKGARNVVSIEDYKLVEHDKNIGWTIWIRMELLKGLVEYQQASGYPDIDETVKIGIDLCTALKYCHERGIVHRDVKPENVFVSEFGDYKLGDFGIAKLLEDDTKSMYSQKGTLTYMAPEVVRGEKYDASADIYSLGVMLYRFLNEMRLPFVPESAEQITPEAMKVALSRRIKGEPLPPPCNADSVLAGIVLRACSADRSERYATVSEMESDLRSWQANNRQPNNHASIDTRHSKKLNRLIILATSVFTVTALAFLIWDHTGGNPKPKDVAATTETARISGDEAESSTETEPVVKADGKGRVNLIGTLSREEGSTVMRGATFTTVTYTLKLDQPTTFSLEKSDGTKSELQKDGITVVQLGEKLFSSQYVKDEVSAIYNSHWERNVDTRIHVQGVLHINESDDDPYESSVVLRDAAYAGSSYSPTVTPQDDPSQYTWEELSKIADLVYRASVDEGDEESSVSEICGKYGLIDENGQLRRLHKSLTLSDGVVVDCTLVDIGRREEIPWGQNLFPSGLTFLCYGDDLIHRFDSQNGINWSESELREWLNTDVISLLPDELSSCIALSCKHGGSVETLATLMKNRGEEKYDYDWHGPDDYLWIPSISEIGGRVDWDWPNDTSQKTEYDELLSAEGDWFKLFSETNGLSGNATGDSISEIDGLEASVPQPSIAMGHSYWLRSLSPSSQRPLYVANDGELGISSDADENRHVAFCFNLGIPRYADGYEKDGIRTYPDPDDSYIPEWKDS